MSPLGQPTGLCIPADIETFVSVRLQEVMMLLILSELWPQLPSWSPVVNSDDTGDRLEAPTSEAEIEVMTAIYNLANTVIANAASRTLAK